MSHMPADVLASMSGTNHISGVGCREGLDSGENYWYDI